jgi:hypothetical protein
MAEVLDAKPSVNEASFTGQTQERFPCKLASRIGLSADVIQTLDSGFRRNDDVISGLFP